MLDLWDTPGQLFYRALNKHFIKDSHCAILGYDITREDSFSEIKEYHYNNDKSILKNDALIYLVANKIDMYQDQRVPENEAINYAKEKNIKYFRISAKTREGINDLFEDIAISLIQKYQRKINNNNKDLIKKIEKNYNLSIIKINAKEEGFPKNHLKILKKYYNY